MSGKKALRIVIVGGVAGGASAAARARRLSEDAEIVMLERGEHVSFANCGLPYYIGGVIKEREKLLVQTPQGLRDRFAIDVRVRNEVVAIDRKARKVRVRDLDKDEEYELEYDKLILSPGADPIRPPLPGMDGENVFTLRNVPDSDRILSWIEKTSASHATVIGGGYIGLEVAENLKHRGLDVTIVEREEQVMQPIDKEMAAFVHEHLKLHGVKLVLGDSVTALRHENGKTAVVLEKGQPFETDMVIVAVGVRPEVKLAKEAGLELGPSGGIKVDDTLRTSDPDIYAIGDAIEVYNPTLDAWMRIPLAGPANRQGRIVADRILGRDSRYRGTIGTSVCKVFALAVAATGASEKALEKAGRKYAKVYLHPGSHAGYYPNAYPIAMKLLYDPDDGKVLGGQAVGAEGVDKRIDVIATAISAGMTVYDLEHLELCYAPPFGSAKDPVNLAGFIASNILRGDLRPIYAEELSSLDPEKTVLLDVRKPEEHENGHIPGSKLIPLNSLRKRLDEIPRDKQIIVYCQAGLRAYVAQRILTQRGYDARNLLGGYKTWVAVMGDSSKIPASPKPLTESFCSSPSTFEEEACDEREEADRQRTRIEIDACGLQCPGPVMKLKEASTKAAPGDEIVISATDTGFPRDLESWCKVNGHELVELKPEGGKITARIRIAGAPAATGTAPAKAGGPGAVTIVVFSGELDKVMASFVIANGARAMGMDVAMFFTFWGINALRKPEGAPVEKDLMETMFGFMMPRGAEKLPLSKMNMAGLGTAMMKHVMSSKKVASLPELIESAKASGVRFVACTMSMDVMGIKKEELIDGVEEGGVATYLEFASRSTINLFI